MQQLEESLKEFDHPWQLNPGDGAFYGPKVYRTSLLFPPLSSVPYLPPLPLTIHLTSLLSLSPSPNLPPLTSD